MTRIEIELDELVEVAFTSNGVIKHRYACESTAILELIKNKSDVDQKIVDDIKNKIL